jgi:hypothetical protein
VIARKTIASALCAFGLLALPSAAQADDFGLLPGSLSVTAENKDGTIDTQAGSHPYDFTVHFDLKTDAEGHSEGGEMRDVLVNLPPGFIGNPQAVPRCPRQKFEGGSPQCPVSTQVGILRATVVGLGQVRGAL